MTLEKRVLYVTGMMSDVERVERKDQPNFARLEGRRVVEFIFNWGITSDNSKS
jgi:hypothetical protein